MLSLELQCFCRGADRVEEALVETRHLTHVRIIGELFLFFQFTRHHVGRERRHPAVLAPFRQIIIEEGDLDGAVVVDLELAKVQATVGILDDRRDRRLHETREPTAADNCGVFPKVQFAKDNLWIVTDPLVASDTCDVHLNIMSV